MKKLTRIDVINETVAYYSEDTSRRSVNAIGTCLYNGPDGKKCAFARYTKNEIHKNLEGTLADTMLNQGVKLKDEVSHLEVDQRFWREVQQLHDDTGNWNKKSGLTVGGRQVVYDLLKKYK